MDIDQEKALGVALATNRRSGTVSPLALRRISSQEQAEAVQSEAGFALREIAVGYVITGAGRNTHRRLGCNEPIYGRVFESTVLPSGSAFPLPAGVLGAGCGWAFTLGQMYPPRGQAVGRESVAPFIVACATTIDIVGRRVPGDVPLNSWTATADYALHVASFVSPPASDWRAVNLATSKASLAIDSHTLATGSGDDIMGNPLNAVAWLAETLQAKGAFINAFDRIFVGSCTHLLQVLPGQRLRAEFSGFREVEISLL